MATLARSTASRISGYPAHNLRFDWLMAALSALFVIGLHLDGWAHNHGEVDNSFFTPWHAVLYGSYALVGLALVVTQFRNVAQGHHFLQALPRGYGLALVGVVLFGFGGGFDFVWHEAFGFEANLEALISPAHLLLASGAFLFLTSPLRAAWYRRDANGWRDLFPAVVSLTLLFALFTFFTQYAHFLNDPQFLLERRYINDDFLQIMRFFGIFTQSALLMGLLLFALRRWQLPFGTITLMLTVNAALYFWMRNRFVDDYPLVFLAPVIGGLIADGLMAYLRPSAAQPLLLRGFAFLVPLIVMLSYFGVAEAAYAINWRIHMWLGAAVMAGFIGIFISYLVVPPAIEVEAR
jgi:hypothetical protein